MTSVKHLLYFLSVTAAATFAVISTGSTLCLAETMGPPQSIYGAPLKSADQWLQNEILVARTKIAQNISPAGAVNGVVIASPQKANPNYFRHWVRDAALTMAVVLEFAKKADSWSELQLWENHLKEFTFFSRQNQLMKSIEGLGEPIFEVNGQVFQGPWGRPQTDGPALRAVVLSQWANLLLDRGQTEFVRTWLYAPQLPAHTVIKADLEFVSDQWSQPSFDLWEEVKGDHFYTRMVQRKALLVGARLADRLGDFEAARWYRLQAENIEKRISLHWDSDRQLVQATRHWVEGVNYKFSDLDIAVVLGVLHGSEGSFFTVSDPRIETTFEKIISAFSPLYGINHQFPTLETSVGRYPEDRYAGTDFDGGNPWVLATMAAAEYCYLKASQSSGADVQKWLARGDRFVQRTQFHSYPDGSLSEQYDRDTGFMTSASDLTWSYSSIVTAKMARDAALARLGKIKN